MTHLKTLIPAFSLVLLAMTGCKEVAKTNSDAPDPNATQVETPTTTAAKSTQDDATSKIRRDQLNSDIRAR